MSTTTPEPSSRKNSTPTHSGDCFGLGFGGGCRGLLLERLFGISRIVVEGCAHRRPVRPPGPWRPALGAALSANRWRSAPLMRRFAPLVGGDAAPTRPPARRVTEAQSGIVKPRHLNAVCGGRPPCSVQFSQFRDDEDD